MIALDMRYLVQKLVATWSMMRLQRYQEATKNIWSRHLDILRDQEMTAPLAVVFHIGPVIT